MISFPTLCLVVVLMLNSVSAMAISSNDSSGSPKKVLVTGAGGKTGKLVLKQLLQRPTAFVPMGVVRTAASKEALLLQDGSIPESSILIADICDASAMLQVCQGMDAIIICTSATPAPTGEMTPDTGRPIFGFPNGQPEQVDWMGQKNQIDAALASVGGSNIHVVICSSMGGTNPENPLNKLGRNDNSDGHQGGNILLWKRKAEKYLMDSGLDYTIIHPGGLLDQEGGQRELVVGINDAESTETNNRSIPRADVAALLIASLEFESYKNRSFDARSKPVGEGTITTNLDQLLQNLSGNCDYTLGVIPE